MVLRIKSGRSYWCWPERFKPNGQQRPFLLRWQRIHTAAFVPFFARSTRVTLAADERVDDHAPVKASLPPQERGRCCKEAGAQEEDKKKKIQGDFISILGSGSKETKKRKEKEEEVPMFSPPFVSQLINFKNALKSSNIPEQTETPGVLTVELVGARPPSRGLPWSTMEEGDRPSLLYL